MEMLLFYIFSTLAALSAIMVISSKNPIHSVLFLVLVFCNTSGLLLLLEAEFLALIFIVVYVGAIAVLFLFVVMMLNIKLIEFQESFLRYLPIGGLIAVFFLIEILFLSNKELSAGTVDNINLVLWIDTIQPSNSIEVLGKLIYTYYCYPFIVSGLILLVSMIGAIVLTLHHREGVKRQDIYTQISRKIDLQLKN